MFNLTVFSKEFFLIFLRLLLRVIIWLQSSLLDSNLFCKQFEHSKLIFILCHSSWESTSHICIWAEGLERLQETAFSYHLTYAFQSESTLYICLNVAPVLSKEFLDIQANIECGFTLKSTHDMIRTYSQMPCADNYSQRSSIILPVWPNG